MRVGQLSRAWNLTTYFQLSSISSVPSRSGVYVLCNVYREVLYIGQSVDVARRLGQHLDDRRMTGPLKAGRANLVFVKWVPKRDLLDEEKRLLFQFKSAVGSWPPLNRAGP